MFAKGEFRRDTDRAEGSAPRSIGKLAAGRLARSLAGLGLLLSVLASVGAASSDSPARATDAANFRIPYFNNPLTADTNPNTGTANPYAPPSGVTIGILDLLYGVLAAAEANIEAPPTVHIALYAASLKNAGPEGDFGDAGLIKAAIVNAVRQGATVDVVADTKPGNDFWIGGTGSGSVQDTLASNPGSGTFRYRECDNGCYLGTATNIGINHNKFITVDKAIIRSVPATDLVLQMSANWTNPQLSSHYWNSALLMGNDHDTYAGYDGYWNALWGCAGRTAQQCSGTSGGDYPSPRSFSSGSGSGVRVELSPRPFTDSTDPVQQELAGIANCQLTALNNRYTTVDVAINTWDDDARGARIENRLRSLFAGGCPVRIVIPATVRIASDFYNITTGTAFDRAFNLSVHCTGGTSEAPSEHSKYMLIRGAYSGTNSEMTFVGSARFDQASLTDVDETWVEVPGTPGTGTEGLNSDVYAAFESNFNEMWSSSPPCSQNRVAPTNTVDDSLDP